MVAILCEIFPVKPRITEGFEQALKVKELALCSKRFTRVTQECAIWALYGRERSPQIQK